MESNKLVNTIQALLLFFFIITLFSCNKQANGLGTQTTHIKLEDTIDILTNCFTYRDTFVYKDSTLYDDLRRKIADYPLDTIFIIKGETVKKAISLNFPGKTIKFSDPPLGYNQQNYIPIDLDLTVNKLTITPDTALCILSSKALGGSGAYHLQKQDNSWKVIDYTFSHW